jgi:hypothetical protein
MIAPLHHHDQHSIPHPIEEQSQSHVHENADWLVLSWQTPSTTLTTPSNTLIVGGIDRFITLSQMWEVLSPFLPHIVGLYNDEERMCCEVLFTDPQMAER